MLFDDDFACALCSERYGSHDALAFHLLNAHGTGTQTPPQSVQHIAPAAMYINQPTTLLSPFAPTPRRTPTTGLPQQQIMYAHYNTPNVWQQAASAYITPPNSTGTPSPQHISQHMQHRTPVQAFRSPRLQPSPSSHHTQQQRSIQVSHDFLPEHAYNSNWQYEVPRQDYLREIDTKNANRPAPRSTPKPPIARGAKKLPSSPAPTASAKLSPSLPPLPKEIYSLGLTDADFDPNNLHEDGGNCIPSKYIDIPAHIKIADEHLFNANPTTVLGYGNLLRLAERYPDHELAEKFNANRPERVFKNPLVKKRLKAAVRWAKTRAEWQCIGDIQAWLDEKQSILNSGISQLNGKRKREDDLSQDIIERASNGWQPIQSLAELQQQTQLLTPPPTKRMRPEPAAIPTTSSGCQNDAINQVSVAPEVTCANSASHHTLAALINYNTPERRTLALPPLKSTTSSSVQNSNSASIDHNAPKRRTLALPPLKSTTSSSVQEDRSRDDGKQDLGVVAMPASNPPSTAMSQQSRFSAADFADLTDTIGTEGAMIIINGMGLGSCEQAPIVVEEEPDNAPSVVTTAPTVHGAISKETTQTEENTQKTAEPSEVYQALWAEFCMHPGHFMSARDAFLGEKWAKYMRTHDQRLEGNYQAQKRHRPSA